MAEPEEPDSDEKAAFAGEEGGGVEASPNKPATTIQFANWAGVGKPCIGWCIWPPF